MTSRAADPATLERAANETRAALAGSLDQLRRSLDPRATGSAALDTVSDAAKAAGVDEFVHNLGVQVRNNPLPVTLVGAGLAWLMLAPRRASNTEGYGSLYHPAGHTGEKVADMGRRLRGAAAAASESLSAAAEAVRSGADATRHRVEDGFEAGTEALQNAREAIGEAGARIGAAASHVSENMREAGERVSGMSEAAMESGDRVMARGGENLQAVGDGVLKFAKENPVLVAVLGAAVGSLIAATLPASSVVRDTMRNRPGGSADDDKDGAAPATEPQTSASAEREDRGGEDRGGEDGSAGDYAAAAETMTGSADAPQPAEPPPPGKTGS